MWKTLNEENMLRVFSETKLHPVLGRRCPTKLVAGNCVFNFGDGNWRQLEA